MLAALLLLGAAPSAAAAPAATAISPATRSNAHALAEMVAPRDIMVPLNVKWAKRALLVMPEHDPESKSLEDEYPGIHRAMWAAAETELERQMESALPKLWTRLESLYVAELNDTEIAGLLKFYRTPTGERMIRSLYANIDLGDAIKGMVKSPDGEFDETSLDAASDDARMKTVSELKPDPADLQLLLAAISLDRLRSVGAKAQRATSEWMNEDDPEGEKRLGELMQKAADQYAEEHPAKK